MFRVDPNPVFAATVQVHTPGASAIDTFTARFRWRDRARGVIQPTIAGSAFVNAEATLLLDDRDPFCWGIGARESIPRELRKADNSTTPAQVGHRRS